MLLKKKKDMTTKGKHVCCLFEVFVKGKGEMILLHGLQPRGYYRKDASTICRL